ncbi:MAG: hypothetical protein ACI4K7_07880, partial [Oscillospiraceae bacterium]
MKNKIMMKRIIPVMTMAAIGAVLLSGCENINDDENAVTPSVPSMTYEADETEEMTLSETSATTTAAAAASAVEPDT